MQNRTFCEGDNLEFLLRMPDASVDLIATDPPFNKNKEFQGIGKAEGANFKDYWSWDSDEDVHPAYLAHVRQHWPALGEVIEAAYAAHSPSMAAFLAFMSVRLIEMHRILKSTGSIYLHCDPTANAYLRLMLDSIFGRDNFRNEIIWHYDGPQRPSRQGFGTKHDAILRYSKTNNYTVNQSGLFPLRKLNPEELVAYKKDGNGRYFYDTPRGDYTDSSIARLETEGRIYRTRSGGVRVKYFLHSDQQGNQYRAKQLHDVWHDIPSLGHAGGRERTGWAAQKPLALYRRIIEASTNKRGLVLDPFAGCATTCVAAEQADRHWIGIDISPKARGITLDRLQKEAGRGTFWEKQVRMLTVEDLRPLRNGITAALAVPQLPERQSRRLPRGYRPEDVRPYLAAREAAGTPQARYGQLNIACQGCGFVPPRVDYQDVDHIIPQAKEGANVWDNFCLLCPPCNRRKAHKLSIEELREAVCTEGLVLDESKLMPMDPKSIAKRDRVLRPLQ